MLNIIKAKNIRNQIFVNILTEYIYYIEVESSILHDIKEITRNNFRIKSINYVIKLISKLKDEIQDGNALNSYPRIGEKTINKINEIIKTKKLNDLEKMKVILEPFIKKNIIINELTEVIGIGKSIAKELVDNYDIKSLDDLKLRVLKGEIKVNDKIILGLKYIGKFKGNIAREEIDKVWKILNKTGLSMRLETLICGSYRRGQLTSNDIDVLIYTPKLHTLDNVKKSELLKEYITNLKKQKFIVDDITNDEITTKYMGFCRFEKRPIRRIDIRLIPYESIYTAMLYFTGSYELNRIMRSEAKKLGYKLNEYGLYIKDKKIDVTSEEDIFKLLKMKYLSPEERNII